MKTLVIAEKPSVAGDLARVLGRCKKNGEFYENDQYVISSAVGHLVELFMPDDIDKKLGRWTLTNLPIVPKKFKLKPIEKTKKKFQELKKLMARDDVSLVVNACDAGREGELIFTYIYELAKCKKPFKRLWMSSMTPDSIREAFANMREAGEMEPLQHAARCRSEADWLIGINGTRAITSRMLGSRRQTVATVGRVQTPTLSIVMERERAIRNFVPKTYWTIEADFAINSGVYKGIYQKPEFEKSEGAPHDKIDRLWEQPPAEEIAEAVRNSATGTIEEKKRRSKQIAPMLYDLTTLQREANSRFGLPAGKTLRIAQSLYEKHKMLTYPRTDSRALPEDYGSTVTGVLGALDGEYGQKASWVLQNNRVNVGDKRVFNNKKISDHFAIIPTNITGKKLSDDEAKIYDMVTRRFICVFYPRAEFDETTRKTMVGEHTFLTKGKVLMVPGWLDVYGKATMTKDTLAPLSPSDGTPTQGKVKEVNVLEDETRPPAYYTEATLLAAMEGAGKLVDDEDLAEAMKERGLGTPATRASTIDHLIREKYMEREGRDLHPTPKAESLLDFLSVINLDDLTKPSLTGDWEYQLNKMEKGDISRDEFMKGISKMTERIVDQAKDFDEDKTEMTPTSLKSPVDDEPLFENFRSYRTKDGEFKIFKTIGNRKMSEAEINTLLTERKIGPLDDFRSKMGKPYSAVLELDPETNKVKFNFGGSNGDGDGEDMDLSEFPVIMQDPKTGSNIHEAPMAYIWADDQKRRVSRSILSRTIPREQFEKLVNAGKTDLLDKFRSKRTNRLFSAHLVMKDDGGIGFEFAPRASKKTAKKATKKAAKKAAKKATKA